MKGSFLQHRCILTTFFTALLFPTSYAFLNFYIGRSEMLKFAGKMTIKRSCSFRTISQKQSNQFCTGIDADLYYVRDGVINEYASKYVIVVPSNESKLHFTWLTQSTTPVSWLFSSFSRYSIIFVCFC